MNAIKELYKKYGDIVFRMALSHLCHVGVDRIKDVNIEESVKEVLASPNNTLIDNKLQAEILKCAYALAQLSLWDILAFVKTDVEISGVTVHPGIIVDFHNKSTGWNYATYVIPSGTNEDTIEEIAAEVREKNTLYSKEKVQSMLVSAFRSRGIFLKPVEQDMSIGI